MPAPPKDIGDYLRRVPPAQRAALQKLREQILSLVPEAEECISYSMPAFRAPGGHVIAGFLATKKGCSYFPFSGTTLDSIAAELTSYSRTKSGLHFDPGEGLPKALLRKLIATRRAELASPAGSRTQRRSSNESAPAAPTSKPARRAKTGEPKKGSTPVARATSTRNRRGATRPAKRRSPSSR